MGAEGCNWNKHFTIIHKTGFPHSFAARSGDV